MKKFFAFVVIFSTISVYAACSSSIGKATINELSVVSGDYLEVVTLTPTPLNVTNWSIYVCRADQNNKCKTLLFSSAVSRTDPNTNRTYYKFPISSGNLNTYQAVLLDSSNNAVDVLNASSGAYYSRINTKLGGCSSFAYDTTANPSAANKLIYRGPDGTGDWYVDTTTGYNDNYTELDTNNNNPVCTIPDFKLTKTIDNATPFVGNNVTFTLTVQNLGCRSTTNATLADTFPASYLTYLFSGYSAGVTPIDPTHWSIAPMAYGETKTVSIAAEVTAGSGITVTNSATVSVANEHNPLDNSASVSLYPVAPIAEYRMDECSWNGDADEVRDSSSSGYHGTLKKKIMTLEGGKVCRAPNAFNDDSYVELSTAFPNLTTNFTITGWFNSSDINQQGQRIFIDDRYNTKGYGLSVNDAGSRFVRFYHRGQPNSGILDASGAPLSSNTWYFAAAVTDTTHSLRHLYVFNSSGLLLDHKSMAINGSLGVDAGVATIGGEPDGGETANRFKGSLDEIKLFRSALTQTQLQTIVNNEKQGLAYNAITRTCSSCTLTPPDCTSFKYDLYHDRNLTLTPDYRLQTRIAQNPFDLNVTVSCTNGTDPIPAKQIKKIYAFSGTCPTVPTGLSVLWSGSADINDTVRTITLTGLNSPKAYSDIHLMLETDTGELNCSADAMTIRPPSFSIATPSSPIRAGDFNLEVSAVNSGGGYDGAATVSTSLQTPNPNCSTSSGFLLSSLGSSEPLALTFQNDTNASAMRATDVGDIDLALKDTTWTNTDQPNDCVVGSDSTIPNAQKRIGCNIENHLSLRIVPYNFDLNATLSNFAGESFTYLSDSLEMNATLDVNITAQNSQGGTTANYDQGCYAKNTSLTLAHSVVPDPLTKILYSENTASLSGSASKNSTLILPFGTAVFNDGNALLRLDFNFDRNSSQPLNPFDFTITSADINDTDNVTGTGIPLGDTTFVYGRARPYDITTNETSTPNPVEFEIYSTTSSAYVSGMPQNVLKWYRNIHHDNAAQGNVIRGGFSAGATESAINVSALPQNGIQIITVTSDADRRVHLDISPWLWYSPKSYNYATDCTQHPCFLYDYTGSAVGVSGVSSGTFQGSDFQMTPAKNITNKGVKVFR